MPLKVSDGIGSWVKDFQKSKAPQFKGKNDEERRDMAIAAYLSAKRGPEKEETVRQEAMSAADKAAHDKAIAAFKAKGGKVKKLKPGYAQGYHGKDDLGTGMHGMLDRGDSKAIGTRKKAASMGALRNSYMEAMDPKMRKVKQLATLGLVGKSDVMKLLTAMKSISDGKEVKPQNRKIIFSAFADLIDLVTGDTAVFQKAKKAVKEEHDPKHIKQAIGIASDPRYAKGNMTGAVKTMNKLSKGIHKHPKVAAVLRKQNEAVETIKTRVGERPKGIGWSLHRSGQQRKEPHDIYKRTTKKVDSPKFKKKTDEAAVNEISKNLARKYVNKAAIDLFHKGRDQGAADTIAKAGGKHPDQEYKGGPEFKGARRAGGIMRATRKLMKKEAVHSADKKPEKYRKPDGKIGIRMVPMDKEIVKKEAMSDSEKKAHDAAIAAFKAKGGKVKKLKPGYAQGWTGKDDLGTGMKGMMSKDDTKGFGTSKKVGSMKR